MTTVVGSDRALSSEVEHLRRQLVCRYRDTVPSETIDDLIDCALRKFEGVSVRIFIPLLVERTVRDELIRRQGDPA